VKPIVGDVLHLVVSHGLSAGECRPAIVVRVQDADNDIYRVHPLYDDDRDSVVFTYAAKTTTAMVDPHGKHGSLHWPKECPCH